MKIEHRPWSVKTRVVLFTILVFLASIWSLTFMLGRIQRDEMVRMLGEQQYSSVSLLASQIDRELTDRQGYLKVAAELASADMGRPAQLQKFLVSKPVLLAHFNSGVFIADASGTVIASLPESRKRIGQNFMDRDFIAGAVREGKSVVGVPVRGRLQPSGIFGMSAPIRDAQGRVVGVLAGITNLSDPNFLDTLAAARYGRTGGYVLAAPRANVIIAATERNRTMTPLPPVGADPLIDQFRNGFDGFGIGVNPQGIEGLAAGRGIPSASWKLVSILPTDEALGPARDMQRRMQLLALLLSVLTGGLTWWWLGRQFAPLTKATLELDRMMGQAESAQPLPVGRADEIGRLITAFNRLLGQVESHKELLAGERQKLSDIILGTGAGTWELDITTGEAEINARWAESVGFTLEELRPVTMETWTGLCHPEDYPAAVADLGQLIADQVTVMDSTFRMRHKQGHWIWVRSRAKVTQRAPDGQARRLSGTTMDVTGEKLAEQALIVARDQAQAASVAKTQFLSNMSHEIRTPMNAIMGLLQLLQATELTGRQMDYVGKAESAARSLLGLINDILDLSKMEAGKMALDLQPFRLDRLLRDLSAILSTGVTDKPVEVLFDVAHDIPRALVGDAMRLKQVLINLGGNAIKFTLEGSVVLQIRVVERTARETTLRFSVIDTGIGIPPEQQDRIFEGFSQAEASTTRRFGGSGLGLSICRQLVDLMGGTLTLDSVPGKGSAFHFRVTLAHAAADSVVDAVPPSDVAAPWHVLVVDDNPLARDILSSIVRSWGWTVDLAASGEAAIARVEERLRQSLPPYDAWLVDWYMPQLDGWQTLERLQALASSRLPGQPLPLSLMVTAHDKDMLRRRQAHERVQLDGYLVKPLTASMLHDAVMEAAAQRSGKPVVRALAQPDQALAGLRILLVEDNLINQQVAQELLAAHGAVVETALNGALGVQAVAQASPPFDVVLMDIQMPVMDGLTATRRIRGELGLATLPVIAMTANAMDSDRADCLAAGMNDHVGKPFDLPVLLEVLQRHTGRAGAPPVRPAAEAPAAPAALDTPTALARLGGNGALYGRILKNFLAEVVAMPQRIEALLAEGQPQQAANVLHTLKGLAGTVGAMALARQASDWEATLKQANGATPAEGLVPALRHAIEAVQAPLAQAVAAFSPPEEARTGPGVAADLVAGLAILRQLRELLAVGDAGALDAHRGLAEALGPAHAAAVAELGHAIAAFDFPQGLAQCEALAASLAGQGQDAADEETA